MAIEKFTTTVMIRRGAKTGFAKVHVAPDHVHQEKYHLNTQEEYQAFVHYTLARDEQFLAIVHPARIPEEIFFGEQDHPKATKEHDFTVAQRAARICLCMRPCNGPGSFCCIWYNPSDPEPSA